MTLKDTVTQAVYRAIDEINAQRLVEQRLPKSPDTVLWDRSSGLDSLGLVSFVVATEESVEEMCGATVDLASTVLVSQASNPMATVGTLVDYIVTQLDAAAAAA